MLIVMPNKTKARAIKLTWKAKEFDTSTKDIKEIVKLYRVWLKKYFGKRCKSRAYGCVSCSAFEVLDVLEYLEV